jgi:PAS domain S-box-containing protein
MIEPKMPVDEESRLAALRGLNILDTPPEERFDRLALLAQAVFNVPIAVISLVDADRQWFKSCQGLDARETPRGISFCGHAILGPDVLAVEDASLDRRFSDNPLVTAGPRIRFYAGAPLTLDDGHAIGTLCLIAPTPRSFPARDRDVLQKLARLVVAELTNVQTAQSERDLFDFFDGAGAIMHSLDDKGRLRMVNKAWTVALGYTREEAIGKNFLEIIPPEDRERLQVKFGDLVATGKPVDLDQSFLAKDGRRLRVKGTASVMRAADGSFRTRSIFRDVSAEVELERLRSEVSHHVSHELKNPLAAISVAVELMRELPHGEEQGRLISILAKQAGQLGQMIADLQDVARAESGKLNVSPSSGDVGAELSALAQSYAVLARSAHLSFQWSPPSQPLKAVFDPVRLAQIVGNLVGNALKYTPAGGTVALGVRPIDGFVEISVSDTGPGMKKEDLTRIFDRLYQTANKAQRGQAGLGLGLYICRELVAAHGGRIWVESALGKGATFRFTLPRS